MSLEYARQREWVETYDTIPTRPKKTFRQRLFGRSGSTKSLGDLPEQQQAPVVKVVNLRSEKRMEQTAKFVSDQKSRMAKRANRRKCISDSRVFGTLPPIDEKDLKALDNQSQHSV